MVLKPKRLLDLGSKSPIQWICRKWVRKLDSNKLDDNYSRSKGQESKDRLVLSKENCYRHNSRRSVLVYISFEFDYKSSSYYYSDFPSIPRSPSLRVFFLFYTIFLLSSPPSTCRLGCWHWSLSHQHLLEISGSNCKAENYYSSIIGKETKRR